MFKNLEALKSYASTNDIKLIDFKIIDLAGRWHHLTITRDRLTEITLEDGIGFDGSSYGFLTVEKSDMVFIPDLTTAFLDPFTKEKTLTMIANIYNLDKGVKRYPGDPRYVSEKAEEYMKASGIADHSSFGPEFEFYILDHFSYKLDPHHVSVKLDAQQAEWNTHSETSLGHHVGHHGGYHVDLPQDVNYDLRNEMVLCLEENGVPVKYHHPEVGGPGQLEIELSFGTAHEMADRTMLLKYIVKNMAAKNNKAVTFMPKPFFQEAGNGMHVHFHLFKDGDPIFYDKDGYSGLSQTALYSIGGMLKHAPALLAITNPSTNSYKRLVPGYEAPVSICFATANRSAVIRIPGYANRPDEKRYEFRSSDATCNPYLAYSALLMAAIDGIKNKIDPTAEGFGPYDVNIFDLPDEEKLKIKGLPKSLEEATQALMDDHEFLLQGDVFTKELLNSIIKQNMQNAQDIANMPHPKEYQLYFDL